MLLNGLTPTSAFAIAGFMFGIFARSASATVLASTTPCDLPTCARTVVSGTATTTARSAATIQRVRFLMRLLLKYPAARRPESCFRDRDGSDSDRRRRDRSAPAATSNRGPMQAAFLPKAP